MRSGYRVFFFRYIEIIAICFLIYLSIGCQSKSQQEVKKAVEANQNSKNLLEYQASPDNPDAILARWTKNEKVKPEEVCSALESLAAHQLMVFSEQIEDSENTKITKPCRLRLQQTLLAYHGQLNEPLHYVVSGEDGLKNNIDFKFEFEIQKRDLSQGYRAVTGDVKPGELILTFDDGPHPRNTLSVLATLESAGVKSIFFEVGKNVDAYPQISRLVAKAGHALGSHTYTHPCLAQTSVCERSNGGHMYSYEEGAGQIRRAHQSVFEAVGFVDPFFRFPYGASSPELHEFLKQNQMGVFSWNIDSEDWRMIEKDGSARTNVAVIQSSLAQLDQAKRGIILFHDIHRRTADLLPEFLGQVYQRGYKIVLLLPTDEKQRYRSSIVRQP